jgi:hypothetical protein
MLVEVTFKGDAVGNLMTGGKWRIEGPGATGSQKVRAVCSLASRLMG